MKTPTPEERLLRHHEALAYRRLARVIERHPLLCLGIGAAAGFVLLGAAGPVAGSLRSALGGLTAPLWTRVCAALHGEAGPARGSGG